MNLPHGSAAWRARFRTRVLPGSAVLPGERDAFREHAFASMWGGLSNGIVLLTDVILAKTLGAPGWQITLLAMLMPAANLLSFYWAGQVAGRSKGSFFLLAGLAGRLPLLLLLFWCSAGWLIVLSLLYNISNALVLTSANAVYKTRYGEETRSYRFGVATSISGVAAILGATMAGAILERREMAYPWLFALAGLAGVVAAYHLYRMEADPACPRTFSDWLRTGIASLRRRVAPRDADASHRGVGESLRFAARILHNDREFVRFERNYMIYGFAFMGLVPVLPLYLVRELHMNYHELSVTKGLWSLIGVVVLSPMLGIAMHRLNPPRFTGKAFLALSLYPTCLFASTWPGVETGIVLVYAALLFFSLAMAAVNISWNLGSMHFAREGDASAYQGLHVAMTGIRGLFAPALGFGIYSLLGARAIFSVAAMLLLVAGMLMLRQGAAHAPGTVSPSSPPPFTPPLAPLTSPLDPRASELSRPGAASPLSQKAIENRR